MNNRFLNISIASALLGLAMSAPANAQSVYITTDTTISTDDSSFYTVGYGNQSDSQHGTNPFSPTVDFEASVGGISAYNSSVVTIGSGAQSFVTAWDNSTINITGGGLKPGHYVQALAQSTVNFYGTNLSATFVRTGTYDLSGALEDGTSLTGTQIILGSNPTATFHLINVTSSVPEPGPIAMLLGMGLTGTGILVRRRNK